MARHAKESERTRTGLKLGIGAGVLAIAVAVVLVVVLTKSTPAHHPPAATRATTTTTSTTSTTTTTTASLPPPGPGFVAGHITAIGDSVMIDYQDPLKAAIPGIVVDATVSRQWGTGEFVLRQDQASGQLGAEVIVGLGTNGPITAADFDAMMSILGGASRVEFVNVHVDRPWQDANNAVLAAGAARYHNVVIADWATLAAANPQWFGSDGTHLAINGEGARALATLVATTLSKG